MSFIQPCFIRKNTPEIRKKLEDLEYEPSYPMVKHSEVFQNIAICIFFGSKYYGVRDEEVSRPGNVSDVIRNGGMIDCGDNEELFLALAALRDDTDKNQYFICTKTYTDGFDITHDKGYFAKCLTDNISSQKYWRKATVEEIIEHFKK